MAVDLIKRGGSEESARNSAAPCRLTYNSAELQFPLCKKHGLDEPSLEGRLCI